MERLLLLLDELEDYLFCLPLIRARVRRALFVCALGVAGTATWWAVAPSTFLFL